MPACPICSFSEATVTPGLTADLKNVSCRTCGSYAISGTAIAILADPQISPRRYVLSGLTRQASDRGSTLSITSGDVAALLASAPLPKTPFEVLNRLLLYIRDHTPSLRGFVRLSACDYPIVFSSDEAEFGDFLRQLRDLGWIENPGEGRYRLTLDGWKKSDELLRVRPDSRRAFVAMWFNEETRRAWEDGLRPGLVDAGYEPIRIDLLEHNDRIDDRILAEIRLSGLLVADFTGNRGGVYFEAGFALGLGLPVIWTCRKDALKHVHFDTRQYNHIVWEEPEELRDKIRSRVLATLPLQGS